MTTTGGQIIWDLDVNAGKFQKGLKSAEREANQVATNINKKLSGQISEGLEKAKRGSIMFAGALGTAAVAVGALGIGALKNAANVQMLRTSFDTLTGSAEKGSALFKDIYNFAKQTPFETAGLASATNTLLAFGVESENVMGNLRMLGDISNGNEQRLQALSLVFGQVAANGRLTGQDLLQMVNAGFNPLQIMSEKTGESMESLRKKMSDGKISFEDVTEAMRIATSEGGRFYLGTAKGAETLTGRLSTLKDQIMITTNSLLGVDESGNVIEGGVFDKISDGVKMVTDILANNAPQIEKMLRSTLGWIQDNGAIVAGVIIGALVPAFVSLAASVWAIMAPLLPFVIIGGALGLIIDTLIDKMGGWQGVMEKLEVPLTVFKGIIKDFILPALNSLWQVIRDELLPQFRELWTQLSPILIPVLKFLGAFLVGVLLVAIRVVIEVVKLWVKQITATIEGLNNFIAKIKEFYGQVKTTFESLKTTVTSAFTDLASIVTKKIEEMWNKIKEYGTKIKDKLSDVFNPFKRNSPSIADHLNTMKQLANETFKDIEIPSYRRQVSALLNVENTEGSGVAQTGVTVNIANANIRNNQDIERLGREFGFNYIINL